MKAAPWPHLCHNRGFYSFLRVSATSLLFFLLCCLIIIVARITPDMQVFVSVSRLGFRETQTLSRYFFLMLKSLGNPQFLAWLRKKLKTS